MKRLSKDYSQVVYTLNTPNHFIVRVIRKLSPIFTGSTTTTDYISIIGINKVSKEVSMDIQEYRTHKARNDYEEEQRYNLLEGLAPVWDEIENEWYCPNHLCGNAVRYDEDRCSKCAQKIDWEKITN